MTPIIQSLWIGPSLSKLEQLSIKSFLDNGHTYHLYTYNKRLKVPKGVEIRDGNEILAKTEIFRYKNGSISRFQIFSDLYCYIKKVDIGWIQI